MRILFVGAVEFSRHCLSQVLQHWGDVIAVLNPAAQDARGNSDYCDLAEVARRHDVPLFRFRKIGDPESVALVRSLEPDVIFVFGLSQLVPPGVLAIPRLGCVGTHPALLPKHRGRHPLIWALVEGLSESGLTFFFLDEGADSGDILWQKSFPITPDDDAATLYSRIEALASEAIPVILTQLATGAAPRMPQDHGAATYWRKRTAADGVIDWSGSATRAFNLVRALTRPYPGATTVCEGRQLRVWRSRPRDAVKEGAQVPPGCVIGPAGQGVLVQCGEGVLELLEWEGVPTLQPGTQLEGRVA